MKKIYLLLLALPLLLNSCLFDDDELFSDSASERMSVTLENIQKVLESAQNGWVMGFYPNSTQEYGGYTLFMKFSKGSKVVVASERGSAKETVESLYGLIADNGPVLTFNTYNDFIHYYSEPMNQDGIGPDDSGMGGDYEFMVLEATPEKITLLGKKTRNKIYMTPLPDGDWADMMEQYINVAENVYNIFRSYDYTVNNITANVKQNYRKLTFTYEGDDSSVMTQSVGFRYTPTGYQFYEPITIGDVEVTEMIYGKEGSLDVFTDAGGSNAKLVVKYPPLNQQLVASNWYFAVSSMGAYTLQQWKLVETALANIGEEMYQAYLGIYSSSYGFSFYSYDGSSLYGGIMVYSYELIGANQIKLICTMTGKENGVWYHNNAALHQIMRTLAYGSSAHKTFTLTADNDKAPTLITLQDDNNPENYFTVSKSVINWPFDK